MIPKRYDITGGSGYDAGLTFEDEDENGDWVKWEDVAVLIDKMDELETKVSSLRAALMEAL